MTDENAVPVSGDDGEGFVAKWRERWPEWPLAEVFIAPAQRPVALAWAALQQELLDAAWGGHDARPGELKLAWWMEELQGWTQGRRRHPLGRVLQRQPAPWAALAAALPALGRSRERPLDADDAFAALESVARAVAGIEASLFDPPPTASSDAAVPLVTATWLATRTRMGDDAAVPLALLEPDGTPGGGLDAWRSTLRSRWPEARGGVPRVRRVWAALARARLDSKDAAPAAPRVLWSAWRAARN